jgi:hypothetical protein
MIIALAATLAWVASLQADPIFLDRPELPKGAYVLVGAARLKMFSQCSRSSPQRGEEEWKPDGKIIYEFENKLFDFLPSVATDWNNRVFPSDYVRQYIGIVRGGRRYIYGNLIALPEQLRTSFSLADQALIMCDGGSSAFGVEYDVEQHKVANFSMNGL